MPKVIFRSPDKSEHEIEVPAGMSLMQAALENGLQGIAGDCGGGLACATCHVFVGEAFLAVLPPISSAENDMLDCTTTGRAPNSRLSCQIKMTDALGGITVRIAETQY